MSNPKDITDVLVVAKDRFTRRQKEVLAHPNSGILSHFRKERLVAMDGFVVFAYSLIVIFALAQTLLMGWMDFF